MGVLWEDEAWQEYVDWQEQDKNYLVGGVGTLMRRTVLYTSLWERA